MLDNKLNFFYGLQNAGWYLPKFSEPCVSLDYLWHILLINILEYNELK